MSSLLKRTAILSFSRFTNQAIAVLSPVLLVRLLSVEEYGSYQQFNLYALLLLPLVTFSINGSLVYLVPKHPEREKVWITQVVFFLLVTNAIMFVATSLFGDVIRASTEIDFLAELQLYLFVLSFEFLETYWLAKKRADLVLYYSTGRLFLRTSTILIAAFLSGSVETIIQSLLIMETIRCIAIFVYAAAKKWFVVESTRESMRLQLAYFLPLGIGAVIDTLNAGAGRLFVSVMAGTEALAFYTIGMFATKIVEVLRGSIADVIFPDMVEVKSSVLKDALPLWKRATVAYAILIFPVAISFFVYADAIVTVLFTTEYSAAIPVFALFALKLFALCFDFHLPLRVQNANRFFLVAIIFALAINLCLLYPTYTAFGLKGPVVASIVAQWGVVIYLARKTMRIYGISVRELVLWSELAKVLAAALIGVPVLLLGQTLLESNFWRGVVFGPTYLAVYVAALALLKVEHAYAFADVVKRMRKRG